MRILVISSCTGHKSVEHENALTVEDFKRGAKHVRARESQLKPFLTPAEDLYTGQQHVRLMRGVAAFREKHGRDALDLRILSAGYGLVDSNRKLAPYEATFQGMKKRELREWADTLGVPAAFREAVAQPYDFGLILLGDEYLEACAVDERVQWAGPTVLFCGARTQSRLPKAVSLRAVPLGNADARRFSCALVSLKGELAAAILERCAADEAFEPRFFTAPDPLSLLGQKTDKATSRSAPRANPKVDQVISIPQSWWDKPHREKLRYFIPEWDDLVDPDFDFENDVHSGGSGDWSNEVYAHQMYPEPNYDGILISKVVAEKSRKKKERINRLGVHRFLRVPRKFPIMGDCGAFGYIHEKVPPYTTEEILDYYTRLDFDYGVSIDHLIVTATESEKKERYDLTIENAAEFLKQHRKAKLPWTPIGAVQGWDAKSYAAAAKNCVAMGYRYIGLGGLVRTSTNDILEVLRKVHEVVPSSVDVHLFGLARIASMRSFAELGVRSVDSASLLRRAWMGTGQNYLSMEAKYYTAIRIPEAGKSFRAKRMVSEGRAATAVVERLEDQCLEALRRFDHDEISADAVLDVLEHYDRLITPDRPPTTGLLRETLEARPWKSCPCDICKRDGIQVVVFRGNNRNRRRGFHNTFVFYRLLQKALSGEAVAFVRGPSSVASQLALFNHSEDEEELVDAV